MENYPAVLMIVLFCLSLPLSNASSASKKLKGGEQIISVDDPGVKRVAEATMAKLRRQHTGERALILVEIEKAMLQIAAGSKYRLHLKVGESVCLKNKYNKRCRLDEDRPLLACGGRIWEKRWMHFIDINVHCNPYDDDEEY